MNRQKAIVIIVLVAVCFGVLSVSASAAIDESFSVPYYGSNGAPYDSGLHLGYDNSGNYYSYFVEFASSSSSIFLVAVYTNGSGYSAVGITNDSAAIYTNGQYSYNSNTGSYSFVHRFNQLRLDRGSQVVIDGLTYYTASSSTFLGSDVTITYSHVYSSYDDAYSALVSALDYNPPPVVEPFDTSFVLPAGSVAFFKLTSYDSIMNLSATMYDLSVPWIAGEEPWFWPSDMAQIGFRSELPQLNSQWVSSDLDMLRWGRADNRNLYGQTKSAVYDDVYNSSDGVYLVLYNPAYYIHDLSDGDMYLSPSISVNIIDVESVTVYSVLQGTINGVSQSMVGNTSYELEEDGSWTDSDGGSSPPPDGGGNYIPDTGDQTGVLDNLVSTIGNFFTGTWAHIRQLIDALGSFPSMMRDIFSFLPSEFTSIILAFFGILVALGVVKALL